MTPGEAQPRLRRPGPELSALPWSRPLEEWDPASAPLRDIPVGPSRHVVRFVQADGLLWAVKELPTRLAVREDVALRCMEDMRMPAVRAGGLVVQPADHTAFLVTEYLVGCEQYRNLFTDLRLRERGRRRELLELMAVLLVEVHRAGVFWGDCSLGNVLLLRGPAGERAWFLDAETSELHERLSDGQRRADLDIVQENITGGLLDLGARELPPGECYESVAAEAQLVLDRYADLWSAGRTG